MSKQEALERYIQELFETDPEWEAKYAVTDDLVGCKSKTFQCKVDEVKLTTVVDGEW